MSNKDFIPSKCMVFDTVVADHKRLLQYCNTISDAIVVNMSDVQQCDSAGLAFLIEAKRLSVTKNKAFSVVGITPQIESLADFCGVTEILLSTDATDLRPQ